MSSPVALDQIYASNVQPVQNYYPSVTGSVNGDSSNNIQDRIQISSTGKILSGIRADAKRSGTPYDQQRVKQLQKSITSNPYPVESVAKVIAERMIYGY